MRTHSGDMIRLGKDPTSALPREGTRIRFVYDYLYEHRGMVVSRGDWSALGQLCESPCKFSRCISDLRDYYGCDIRGRSLIGEWSGRIYLDYTAEAQAQAA